MYSPLLFSEISKGLSMCRNNAGQVGVRCLHILYQYPWSPSVGGKHLVMDGQKQFHASCCSQIGSFPFIEIAHQILLFTEIVPTIDREAGDVDMQFPQALDHAVIDDGITGVIHPHPSHLDDIAEVTIQGPLLLHDEIKAIDRRWRGEPVKGR